jgi:serine/threonine-protein kinase
MGQRICPHCQQPTNEAICPEDGYKTVDASRFLDVVDPRIGQLFEGRYLIRALIGRGGFGAVYRADQVGIGRPVAIKVLNAELSGALQEVARFQQEARALATLKHPNVVGVYDFGQSQGGDLYLVLEYLEGQPLSARLEQLGPLAPEDALEVGLQVLDALGEAHALGIVHRDLKPANIMLTTGPRGRLLVKLLDFGIARVSGEAAAKMKLTQTGMAIGSPPYMSPEQCSGKSVDHRSDLYSLGCILYECLTGRQIFQLSSPTAYYVAHVTEEPDPFTIGARPAEGPLVDLVMSLLAKSPDDRPQSCDEVTNLLEDATHEGLRILEAGPDSTQQLYRPRLQGGAAARSQPRKALDMGVSRLTSRAPSHFATTGPSALPTPAPASPAPVGRKWIWLAVAIVAALVVGVLVLVLMRPRDAALAGATDRDVGRVADAATLSKHSAISPDARPVAGDSVEAAVAETVAIAAPDAVETSDAVPPDAAADLAVHGPREVEPPDASAPASGELRLAIASVPNAIVSARGKVVGTTPLTLAWPATEEPPVLTFRAKGYFDREVRIAPEAMRDGLKVSLKPRPREQNPEQNVDGPTW